jgi:hypothetical protein
MFFIFISCFYVFMIFLYYCWYAKKNFSEAAASKQKCVKKRYLPLFLISVRIFLLSSDNFSKCFK